MIDLGERSSSETLQHRHPDSYAEFFKGCHIVTSSPSTFWIVGEHLALRGGIGAKQALPLRVFCGLYQSEKAGVHLERRMQVYSAEAGRFEERELKGEQCPGVEEIVGHLAPDLASAGLGVRLLSEAPVYAGFGVSGAIAAALATALFTVSGVVRPEIVEHWDRHDRLDRLLRDQTFARVFKAAWELELPTQGYSSGATPFCALVGARLPVVYGKQSSVVGMSREEIARAQCTACRFDEILADPKVDWPIDYCLIFSGQERGGPARETLQNDDLKDDVERIHRFWSESVRSERLPGAGAGSIAPDRMLEYYNAAIAIQCTGAIASLGALFEGPTDATRQQFFRDINFFQSVLRYLDKSHQKIDALGSFWLNQPSLPAAVKISGAGQGGDVVLFTPHGSDPEIRRRLDQYNAKTDSTAVVHYSLAADGGEPYGTRVEHFPPVIVSRFAPPALGLVTMWDNGRLRHRRYRASAQDLAVLRQDCELVFDLTEKDILVRGESVRGLLSKTVTLHVFGALLVETRERGWGEGVVDSSTFPSYTHKLAQFRTVVLRPLHVALTRIGKTLDVAANGPKSNYWPYTVTLRDFDGRMALIEELNS